MNWHKRATSNFLSMGAATAAVERALMALKYLKPEVDPLGCDIAQLAADLAETGKVPAGVNPERFAAMAVWHLRNKHEGEL